jgi:hypothetical protein
MKQATATTARRPPGSASPRRPIGFAVAAAAHVGLIVVAMFPVADRQRRGDPPATQGRIRRRRFPDQFGRSKTSHLHFVDRPSRSIAEQKAGRRERR